MVGRIPVMNVTPLVDLGRRPAKATVGEPFPVTASVFREGHDRLGAEVVLTDPDGVRRPPVRMTEHADVPDLYEAWLTPDAGGAWTFEIQAWSSPLGTWFHDGPIKIRAGVDVELMFTEGRLLFERVRASLDPSDPDSVDHGRVIDGAIESASDETRPAEARLAAIEDPAVITALESHPIRELLTVEGPYPAYADRTKALFSSWYEFFPRSEGAKTNAKTGKVVSGTFKTAAKRLDAVAAMGFDVIYLPPIHPIGEVNRKGPNNTLDPGPGDPGSPWAIGSKHGGHDAIHPDLGTFKDFDAFVARAGKLGLEVALDLALQAAPDHPWVTSHPEWFTTRADGTIAYAENPPKKYQDIYPINFDNDPTGIGQEVLRIVRLWMSHGVRIFRVDNPHTKPVAFWEWLLTEVRRTDPDVLFLAEAFTRPAMMRGLGAVGFQQSYTYFTWRNAKWEIEEYLRELSRETDHLMRPNFFVNTPDILHAYLQYGGPAAFKIRAAIAATGSPSWGVYAGFELFEHVAVRPGSEEYLDSEKYQVRIRDWAGSESEGRTLAPYLTRLNEIRRAHPALQLLRNVTIHWSDDENILVFSKAHEEDTVIVVVNVDPHATRETTVHLDLAALGFADTDSFVVHDEITGEDWTWSQHNYVRLDPHHEPAHILSVRRTA
ncbi:alpha-1,4-glucan--maltose-1-phosphate maltosyltransferase [Nocardioides sp. Root1257]|uniref:alpha-1,4-glucan--maltose-1-phosphate maltosyltransferase n=1 Tax=unclassified Nocardioides TaxID=2615069 RepID=UPI0006FF7AA7|nr:MULTISPECIES: alpha-1,4-glucan--maltose-1-phosphate maltosyltransferase [unclassified Nocardioides]KQW52580.1 alpha-1,4-glucan--maltose-1-phosphate maltosyltransferase [Nocardioides sp. Root1257]KRC54643.1 alpha-1,4-glucan--maltose-1-phosphate maltosyltransferase [Nocardioides sp. Root224]